MAIFNIEPLNYQKVNPIQLTIFIGVIMFNPMENHHVPIKLHSEIISIWVNLHFPTVFPMVFLWWNYQRLLLIQSASFVGPQADGNWISPGCRPVTADEPSKPGHSHRDVQCFLEQKLGYMGFNGVGLAYMGLNGISWWFQWEYM